MKEGIILESVGSFISSSGVVYPLKNDNTPNLDEGVGVHLSDCDSEWISKLSDEDTLLIDESKYVNPPTRYDSLDSVIVDVIIDWFSDKETLTKQDLDTLLLYSQELYNNQK